jgi:dienelactone hydrolase
MKKTLVATSVALMLVIVGCTLAPPPGDAPLRYRDQVFASADVTTDLSYGSAPDAEGNPVDLKLDVYQPTGDTVTGRPALIWVHGGGFTTGDKSTAASRARYFARLGYVVLSINYRLLSPTGCGGASNIEVCINAAFAAQHDAQAAVRWLRSKADVYRVDTDRIAMGGGSAGAVTSLLVSWRANDPGDSGNPGYPSNVAAAVSVSGGVPVDGFIDTGEPPAIFFHGTEDQVVPFAWAASNAATMFYEKGIYTVFQAFEGEGHGIGNSPLVNQQASYFLYYVMHLKDAPR